MPSPPPSDSSAEAGRRRAAYSPTNRYPELAAVAQHQHWVLSRGQLTAAGWNRHRVAHEIAVGRWSAVAPSVVALQNAPLTRPQLMWLGVLHAGSPSALTHTTSVESHGIAWTVDPVIHVLTQKGDLVAPLRGFRFHQTRRHFQRWIEYGDRHPPRILLEHAVLLTAERDRNVRRAIGLLATTVQQRRSSAERLRSAAAEIRKLRHGQQFRWALGDIAGGAESFAEIDLVALCNAAGLMRPTRQARRRDSTGRWRWLDVEWDLGNRGIIALEVDGSFHMETEHWWRDKKRERAVTLTGRTVLRCATVELRLTPQEIVADLVAAGIPHAVVRPLWERAG